MDLKLNTAVNTAPAPGTSETWSCVVPSGLNLVAPGALIGQYRGFIDSEIVLWTAGSIIAGVQNLTIIRGAEGTTPAIHAANAVIKLDTTAGSLANMLQLNPSAAQSGSINITGGITFGGTLTTGGSSGTNGQVLMMVAGVPTWSSPNTFTSDVYLPYAPATSANHGMVNLGDGGFAGGSQSFNGSPNGTFYAANKLATSAYLNAVVADSPAVFYRLAETTGTVAADSSGHGRDAAYALGGNLTRGVAGATASGDGDKGIQANGTAASILSHTFSSGDLPSGSSAFTIEFYYKTSANIGYPGGIDLFQLGNIFISLNGNAGQANSIRLTYGGNGYLFLTNSNLADGAYHQVALIWSGSSWTVLFDGNGTFQRAGGDNWSVSPGQSTTPAFNVGTNFFYGGYSGVLDEVAVYPSALTGAQLANHRAAATQPTYFAGDFFNYQVNGISVASLSGAGALAVRSLSVNGTSISGGFANPMTTAGDLILGGTAGAPGRLAKGTDGYILTMDPGTHLPLWAPAPTSGFSNPMTSVGDIIVGGAAGAATRVAAGTNGYVLTMVSGSPAWAVSSGGGGGGTVIQGGASTKVQLTFDKSVDASAIALNTSTWTTVEAAQTFTVDDSASEVEIEVTGYALFGPSAAIEAALRLNLDSGAQTRKIAGAYGIAGNNTTLLGGTAKWTLTGLTAGTHTVSMEGILVGSGTASYYCRASSTSNVEFLRIQVLERKTTMNTSAAPVSGAKLTQTAAQTGLTSGSLIQMTFDTNQFDTDSLRGTGAAPWNQLVVTKAGKYLVGASAGINQASMTYAQIGLKVNGSIVSDNEGAISGSYWFAHTDTILDLKVGDVVTAWISQTSGGSASTYVTGGVPVNQLWAISLGGIVSGTAQSKVQLDYTASTDLAATGTTAASYTTVTTQTFTVDDANSLIEIDVSGDLMVTASSGNAAATRLLIDGSTTKLLSSGYLGGPYSNALAGAGTVTLSGLAAGSHTVALQIILSAGSFQAKYATGGSWENLSIRVIERKLVPASPSYANVNKVQLDYKGPGGSDLANALSLTNGSFVNVGSAQSFPVDDPNSAIELLLTGSAQITGSAAVVLAVSIDGGAEKKIETQHTSAFYGTFGGSLNLGSLSAGSHTMQLRAYANNTGVSLYWRTNSTPATEFLDLQIIERKLVNTGTGGTLDEAVLTSTAATSIPTATFTQIPLATVALDTHSLTGTANAITIQTPGLYKIDGFVAHSSFTGRAVASIYLNGAELERDERYVNGIPGTPRPSVTRKFVAGDVLTLYAWQNSGGSLAIGVNPTFSAFLSATRLDGYAINPMTTLNDMIRGTTGGAPERVASTGVQGSIFSTDATGKPGWNGLLNAEAHLTSDLALTYNTWNDVLSITLPCAGTWLIMAYATGHGIEASSLTIRIQDVTGAVAIAASSVTMAGNGYQGPMSCLGEIVSASGGTVKLQCFAGDNSQVLSSTLNSVAGATRIVAYKRA